MLKIKPILLAPVAAVLSETRTNNPSLSANSLSTILDGVSSRLDESREILRYMIGLLVFLGLLGTFWGLLITIETVGQTISNMSIDEENILTNFANLKESLKAPLAGMGIAFSSSLFGLTSSLCLGFIDLQGSRAQNTFLDNLESVNLNSNAQVQSSVDNVGLEYVEALLHQTVGAINKLEKSLTKNEELRKIIIDINLRIIIGFLSNLYSTIKLINIVLKFKSIFSLLQLNRKKAINKHGTK